MVQSNITSPENIIALSSRLTPINGKIGMALKIDSTIEIRKESITR